MGEPFPPPWEAGASCGLCVDILFNGRTPKFIYAFVQGVTLCPQEPPIPPSPNGVVRMTQLAISPCWWTASKVEDIYNYGYDYFFTLGISAMYITDISGFGCFASSGPPVCQNSFSNQLICGPPHFPAFSGGTVDCFW